MFGGILTLKVGPDLGEEKTAAPKEFAGFADLIEGLEYEDVFQVGSVDVMKSSLMPTGAIYEVIDSATLEL